MPTALSTAAQDELPPNLLSSGVDGSTSQSPVPFPPVADSCDGQSRNTIATVTPAAEAFIAAPNTVSATTAAPNQPWGYSDAADAVQPPTVASDAIVDSWAAGRTFMAIK